jgi:hypothetical protein
MQAARLMESLDAANLVNTELCEKLKELQACARHLLWEPCARAGLETEWTTESMTRQDLCAEYFIGCFVFFFECAQVRRSSQPPSRYWQADHDAPSCNGCSGSFSLTNRRVRYD